MEFPLVNAYYICFNNHFYVPRSYFLTSASSLSIPGTYFQIFKERSPVFQLGVMGSFFQICECAIGWVWPVTFPVALREYVCAEELTHWKRLWCWEGLGPGGEGNDRGWDGWMASPTRWMWVWVNSRSWWWTGRPGMLQFMGWQRVGHDWASELSWTESNIRACFFKFHIKPH